MKLETIAVHGGQKPDPSTKAVAVPIVDNTVPSPALCRPFEHGADIDQALAAI